MSEYEYSCFDEAKYEYLKKEITLSSMQLLELTYNDAKFIQKLRYLTEKGSLALNQEYYFDASLYFSYAYKVLYYAASCGKSIERSLIITILNNYACVQQRQWDYNKCSSYVYAIIFNLTYFIDTFSNFQYGGNILQNDNHEHLYLTTYLDRSLILMVYQLQFCALNSQIQQNYVAYKSASKAIRLLQIYCGEMARYYGYYRQAHPEVRGMEGEKKYAKVYYYLLQAKEIEDLDKFNYYEKYLAKVKHLIREYERRIGEGNIDYKLNQYFSTYSVGILMLLKDLPIVYNTDYTKYLDSQLTIPNKIYKVIYMSMGYFTLATYLRLIANNKYPVDYSCRKGSKYFRYSQIYHLISIALACKYLPCPSSYFNHLVNSFNLHYQYDLLVASRGFNEEGDGGNVFGLLHDREGEGKVEEVANGKKEVTSAHGQSQHNNGHKQASDIHHGQYANAAIPGMYYQPKPHELTKQKHRSYKNIIKPKQRAKTPKNASSLSKDDKEPTLRNNILQQLNDSKSRDVSRSTDLHKVSKNDRKIFKDEIIDYKGKESYGKNSRSKSRKGLTFLTKIGKTLKMNFPRRADCQPEQNGKMITTEYNWTGSSKRKQMNNQKLKSPQRTVMEKMRGTKVTCKMTTSEHKSATKEMNVMKSPRGNCENRKKIKSPKNTHQ